jgi:transcriptional regulator with XRE-family HTH domain/predicted membrane protein
MEQNETLGKRIAALRKEKGLTQEQLAEKVGVSPQAVSKWENDVSCPDITLLPLLADLFGVSVDELLGVKPVEPHVIILDKDEMPRDEKKKGSFSFEWNKHHEKWSTITFCIGVILVCLFFVLHSMAGVFPYIESEEMTLKGWNYVWPLLVFTLGLSSVRDHIAFGTAMMAFGGYEFVRRVLLGYNVCNLPAVRWYLIVLVFAIAVLVMIIIGRTHIFRKKNVRNERDGVRNSDRSPRMEYSDDNDFLNADMSFGNGVITYERATLLGGEIDSNFGDYTIDLRNVVSFGQGCLLKVDQSFGNVTILLPRCVRLVKSSDTTFAAITVTGDPDPDATQTVILRADVNFGSLQVKYN